MLVSNKLIERTEDGAYLSNMSILLSKKVLQEISNYEKSSREIHMGVVDKKMDPNNYMLLYLLTRCEDIINQPLNWQGRFFLYVQGGAAGSFEIPKFMLSTSMDCTLLFYTIKQSH